MGHITHPNLGSPMAMVTPYAELVTALSSEGKPYHIDDSTHDFPTIEHEHHKVHDGDSYFVRGFITIPSSGGSITFVMKPSNNNKWTHLTFSANADNLIEVSEFENTTWSGGIPVVGQNHNRNSPNVYGGSLSRNPDITISGNLIGLTFFGAAGVNPTKAGVVGEGGRSTETILKSGTSYLWSFKAGGNNTKFGYVANFYENIDETTQF